MLPQCDACREFIWYPRLFCPLCGSLAVTYRDVSGTGSIYTFTVVRRGDGPYKPKAPYVVAYVTLDEGATVLTNVIDCDPETITIGQRVRVVFERAGEDGADAIPRFTPV
jgi:uncharacterized protein